MRPLTLQNEGLRLPKPPQEAFVSALGVAWGGSWGSPGTVPSAPGLLWGCFGSAWGQHLECFWMVFVAPGGVRRENGDKLEFDDPLNEIVMFSRPQASQNELKLVPKRAERRKESREDANREQRRHESAFQTVRGALGGDIWAPRRGG